MPHDSPWSRLGLAIGHATDPDGATGCTVIRGLDGPFRCASALLGRASGTRELPTTHPAHLVDRADALLLAGGSAYGLAAADGVMRWCEERGRGVAVPGGVVPIVPAAVVFDLAPLGRFDARPTAAMGYAACEAAGAGVIAEGSVGAGTGTTVGKVLGAGAAMKGGVGLGAAHGAAGEAAAVAVVNAFGDVRDGDGRIIAGARDAHGGFADGARVLREGIAQAPLTADPTPGTNTTLVCVAVSVPLGRTALSALATAATAALHRRITPVGTPFDGDVVFALAPALTPVETGALERTALEALVVAAVEQAIERAVRTARGTATVPGLADDA